MSLAEGVATGRASMVVAPGRAVRSEPSSAIAELDNGFGGPFLERRRVVDALQLALGTGLVVVEAPAGWGKTTAVRQLLREIGHDASWLALDDTTCVEEALSEALAAWPQPDLEVALDVRAAERKVPGCLLVIDGIQHCEGNPRALERLNQLVRGAGRRGTLVLVSRGTRYSFISERVVENRSVLVTVEHLAFDRNEIEALMLECDVSGDVDEVKEATGGWPAGVAAFVGALTKDSAEAAARWAKYVDDVVLADLSTPALTSLKTLSLLETVGVSVAERAVGGEQYAGVRAELGRGRLPPGFIEGGRWRVHPQVRERLRERSRADGPWVHGRRTLRLVASLRAGGHHIEALGVAVRERLAGAAAAILRDHAERALWAGPHEGVGDAVELVRAKRGTVPKVFEALRAESLIVSKPRVTLMRALRLLESPDMDAATECISVCAALAASRLTGDAHLQPSLAERLRSILECGPVGQQERAALELARHVAFDEANPQAGLRLLEEKVPGGHSPASQAVVSTGGHSTQVMAMVAAGEFENAIQYGREILASPPTAARAASEGVANNLSLAFAARGDRFRSLALARSVAMPSGPYTHVGRATGRATMIEILLMQGRPSVARELLHEWFGSVLRGQADQDLPPRLLPVVLALSAAVEREMGKTPVALRLAKQALHSALSQRSIRDTTMCAIEVGRCLILQGLPDEAIELLAPVAEQLARTGELLALKPADVILGIAATQASREDPWVLRAQETLTDAKHWPVLLPLFIDHRREIDILLGRHSEIREHLAWWTDSQMRVNSLLGDILEPIVDIRVKLTAEPQLQVGPIIVEWEELRSRRVLDVLLWWGRDGAVQPPEFSIHELREAVYSDLPPANAIRLLVDDLRWLQGLVPGGTVMFSPEKGNARAVIAVSPMEMAPDTHDDTRGSDVLALGSPFVTAWVSQRGDKRMYRVDWRNREPWVGLPHRLQRLLPLVAAGCSNKGIARDLRLSEHTIENYMSQLLRAAGCQSRTELALAARDTGVPPAGTKSLAFPSS